MQLTALGRMHVSLAISGVLWQRLRKQNIREDLKKLNKYWEFFIQATIGVGWNNWKLDRLYHSRKLRYYCMKNE